MHQYMRFRKNAYLLLVVASVFVTVSDRARALEGPKWFKDLKSSVKSVGREGLNTVTGAPISRVSYRHVPRHGCPCPQCAPYQGYPTPGGTASPSPSDQDVTGRPSPEMAEQGIAPEAPDFSAASQQQTPTALASFRGAASGPTGTPNMIGDAFGGLTSGNSWFVIQGSPIPITLQFAPLGGSFGEANPILGAPTDPVTFDTVSENINGIVVPATTFSTTLLLNQFPGTISPGDRFELDNGDSTYQTARAAALASQFPQGGQTTFLGGEAELNVEDGSPGITSGDEFFVSQFVLFQPNEIVHIPVPSPGLIVGRVKIAENGSPFPRDRVFLSHSLFDNVPLAPGGVNVNRFVPGFEKTFYNGLMSIETRVPFAVGLDSQISADGITNTSEAELGDLTMFWKSLLWCRGPFALAGGMGVSVPTADDVRVSQVNGTQLIRIENEAVRLLPYIGTHHNLGRFFAQTFLQLDFNAQGNPVRVNADGNGLTEIGTLQDTPLIYADASLGWWAYRSSNRRNIVAGIAPVGELHFNRSLSDTDVVSIGNFQIGDAAETIALLNGVVGIHAILHSGTTITMGFTTPLGGGNDQQFDGEFRLMINQYFGRTLRQSPSSRLF